MMKVPSMLESDTMSNITFTEVLTSTMKKR